MCRQDCPASSNITTGSSSWDNAQPIYRSVGEAGFALGHNGNLVNTKSLALETGTLVGTVTMVGIASLMGIPVGIASGIYLVEYGDGRWAAWVRLATDVLVGAPSIAIGLFAYALVVAPFQHFSALSASFALAGLRIPATFRTYWSAAARLSH